MLNKNEGKVVSHSFAPPPSGARMAWGTLPAVTQIEKKAGRHSKVDEKHSWSIHIPPQLPTKTAKRQTHTHKQIRHLSRPSAAFQCDSHTQSSLLSLSLSLALSLKSFLVRVFLPSNRHHHHHQHIHTISPLIVLPWKSSKTFFSFFTVVLFLHIHKSVWFPSSCTLFVSFFLFPCEVFSKRNYMFSVSCDIPLPQYNPTRTDDDKMQKNAKKKRNKKLARWIKACHNFPSFLFPLTKK